VGWLGLIFLTWGLLLKFFWHSGIWTQGLHLEPPHQPFFCAGFFWDRVSPTICLGWLWTAMFLISASWVARITGVSCWHLAIWGLLCCFVQVRGQGADGVEHPTWLHLRSYKSDQVAGKMSLAGTLEWLSLSVFSHSLRSLCPHGPFSMVYPVGYPSSYMAAQDFPNYKCKRESKCHADPVSRDYVNCVLGTMVHCAKSLETRYWSHHFSLSLVLFLIFRVYF
jgi:hypothetical protein